MADFSSLKQTIQSYIKQNGNEEITGNILQDVLLAMVSTMGDSAINSLASALQDEITARQNQDGTLQGNITAETTARQQADTALGGRIDGLQTAINGINTKLEEGYIYAGIATPSTNPGTPSGKVFYLAVQAGIYTNFGGTVVTEGITALKYNGTSWVKEQELFTDGGVFDISAYNNDTYDDLADALSGNNIPLNIRKGGMSVKFAHTDNMYEQYMLTLDSWSDNAIYWQKINGDVYGRNTTIQISSRLYDDLIFSPGTPVSIKLISYDSEDPLMVFGIISAEPLVFDTISEDLQVGQKLSFEYKENWTNIRIYKRNINTAEINVSVESIQQEVEGTIENIQFSSRQYNNLVFSPNTPIVVKLVELENANKVSIFGIISTDPLVFDTIASDIQVGQEVIFEYKEDWTNIRLYQAGTGNIVFDVAANGINQEIALLNQKIDNIELESIDSIDRLPSLSENPLQKIMRAPGYGSIIHSWGIIGDSLSSGSTECREIGTTQKIFLDRFEYSWGQRLFKLLGVEGYNFSYSGQQAKPWCLGWTQIQTTSTPPATTTTPEDRIWDGELVGVTGQHGAKYNPKQGYIIAMGVNDKSRQEYPLGTLADINLNDYTQNGDSFYGWYAGIIQRVRSINSRCFVFCVTRPNDDGDSYDQAIRDIVGLFDRCYCIDLSNGVNYNADFKQRYYLGGHMNAAGYEYTAYVMNTYIDWIIRNNFDDFIDAAVVGTQYEIIPK